MGNGNVASFIKWAGGKKQLLDQLKPFIPDKVDSYIEPFVGGGALAFYILQNYSPKKVILADSNEELVNAYLVIKDNVEDLISLLKVHRANHCKDYYYKIRALSTKKLSRVEGAARFIYLNKTCYNGFGNCNWNVSSLKCESFEKILEYAQGGDFVYFDPPYYPLKKGLSFTTYTKETFYDKEHSRLANVLKQLANRGCKIVLSNSDTDFIRGLYSGYNINTVSAKRFINCNGNGRGRISELVITVNT